MPALMPENDGPDQHLPVLQRREVVRHAPRPTAGPTNHRDRRSPIGVQFARHAVGVNAAMAAMIRRPTSEAVRVPLPTPYGVFDVHAFERASGHVYVAMVLGDIGDGDDVLVRLHSECLTGDALGSLRCDCGVQLRLALRMIAAERRGVAGLRHRARGPRHRPGEQAPRLRRPGRRRRHRRCQRRPRPPGGLARLHRRPPRSSPSSVSARCACSPTTPARCAGLRAAGTSVNAVVPLPTAPHHRNIGYLDTKAQRMGHVRPTGQPLHDHPPAIVGRREPSTSWPCSVTSGPMPDRPFVVLKYAQTLDGRIATVDRRFQVDQR